MKQVFAFSICISFTYQTIIDTLKQWHREKEALIETNQIMETKIKGLMDELRMYSIIIE